jgi:hypothetical protein
MSDYDPDQSRKLDNARVDVTKLGDTIAELRRQVDNQAALLRALFVLLREKHDITETTLLDHFRAALAERANPTAKMCVRCGRPVNLKFQRCMYCDEPQPVASAFELV